MRVRAEVQSLFLSLWSLLKHFLSFNTHSLSLPLYLSISSSFSLPHFHFLSLSLSSCLSLFLSLSQNFIILSFVLSDSCSFLRSHELTRVWASSEQQRLAFVALGVCPCHGCAKSESYRRGIERTHV